MKKKTIILAMHSCTGPCCPGGPVTKLLIILIGSDGIKIQYFCILLI